VRLRRLDQIGQVTLEVFDQVVVEVFAQQMRYSVDEEKSAYV
jgi:hypothetical protein